MPPADFRFIVFILPVAIIHFARAAAITIFFFL